jgi:hypothetical protein
MLLHPAGVPDPPAVNCTSHEVKIQSLLALSAHVTTKLLVPALGKCETVGAAGEPAGSIVLTDTLFPLKTLFNELSVHEGWTEKEYVKPGINPVAVH